MKKRVIKIIFVIVIVIGLLAAGLIFYARTLEADPNRPITWGVTFSQKFAQAMGLDWRENYEAILRDLKVKNLRLVAYWDLLEPEEGKYDFSDLDWQINLAKEGGAKLIIAVGQKVPRWPECHYPKWAENLPKDERNKKLLPFLEVVVKRYKNLPNLLYWQVENEPFLPFGECPRLDKAFLDEEIKLVKSLDKNHPILVTDSGEIGRWYFAAKRGGVFGTTMYRRVYNDFFGHVDYHLPPGTFRLKEKIVRFILGDYTKKFIVVELAAEPWLAKQLYETSPEEQLEFFDFEFFKDTLDFARKTGFDEYYLWGVEWWYYMKAKGHPEFWNEAKKLFK